MSCSREMYVFIGPPGAGKGSLSQLLTERLGWKQLSTGMLCRKHVAQETELGQQIEISLKSGKLVDDSIIIAMVEKWLSEHLSSCNGIILDGFPRTVPQAQALDVLLRSKFPNITLHIVKLDVAKAELIKRLSSRVVCENKDCQAVYSTSATAKLAPKVSGMCDRCSGVLIQRTDDKPDVIKQRFDQFVEDTRPLFDYYHEKGHVIYTINASQPLEEVFDEFKTLVVPV